MKILLWVSAGMALGIALVAWAVNTSGTVQDTISNGLGLTVADK